MVKVSVPEVQKVAKKMKFRWKLTSSPLPQRKKGGVINTVFTSVLAAETQVQAVDLDIPFFVSSPFPYLPASLSISKGLTPSDRSP